MTRLIAVLLILAACQTVRARSLEEIRQELEDLRNKQTQQATESDCFGGIELLGVKSESPGGIYKLRPDHPAVLAVSQARTELGPLEDNVYRASESLGDAKREVQTLQGRVAELDTQARAKRAESVSYRNDAAQSSDADRKKRLYDLADEADSKAAAIENEARTESGKLQTATQALATATGNKASADAAARPVRARYSENLRSAEAIAEKCK